MIDLFHNIVTANNMRAFYGAYFLLWVIALLYMIYHRKTKIEIFQKLGVPTFVGLLVVFNPLCAIIIDKCLQGSFWRVFWVFNIVIVIACVETNIVFDLCKKRENAFVVVFLFIIIVLNGNQMYSTKNFQQAENVYKIPNDVIEICEILQENRITKNVAFDRELAVWVRQYDATIQTVYGRDFSGKIGWGIWTDDMELLLKGLEEKECDCLVIAKTRNLDKEISQEGYEKFAETDLYDIWKVR